MLLPTEACIHRLSLRQLLQVQRQNIIAGESRQNLWQRSWQNDDSLILPAEACDHCLGLRQPLQIQWGNGSPSRLQGICVMLHRGLCTLLRSGALRAAGWLAARSEFWRYDSKRKLQHVLLVILHLTGNDTAEA